MENIKLFLYENQPAIVIGVAMVVALLVILL